MIKVENIETWGFEHAIRGMRNPLNSWDKSDSEYIVNDNYEKIEFQNKEYAKMDIQYKIGSNDLDLMRRLFKAGTEHRKYLRQIMVSMDITAPLYWWKEFDTYKVGTTANSCSTMHTITKKEFELSDFSYEHLDSFSTFTLQAVVITLNHYRENYLEAKNKEDWWQLIQLLPTSYNQKRTVTFNYENVFTFIKQRTNHKLDEWNEFVEILKTLPHLKEISAE